MQFSIKITGTITNRKQLNIFNSQECKGSVFLTCNICFNKSKGLCYIPAFRYIVKVSVSINHCAFMFEVNVRKELHSQFVSKYHNNSLQQSRPVGIGEREGGQEGDPPDFGILINSTILS